MYSTILAGNSSNNYDGYNDIAPPPPPLPSLPLYLRFVLSKQTHLSTLSTQQQQENIIYLDHGFQLALFLHSDDNRSNYSYNHSHNQDRDKHNDGDDGNQQPLSQSTTVVDSDTTATITTTPTIVHTPLSDTTKPPGLYSKERIDIDNNVFSDFFQHAAAQSSTTFHHDRNITNHKECQSTVLEMALTLGGHQDDDDEYAKEFYGSMIHVIHLMEIDLDGDRLYMSKAVCGYDLIRQGVSFLVDTDDMVKKELCTLGILLSSNPLELLVPPNVIDQSVANPYGRSTLIRFLLDTHSADVAYSPFPSPSPISITTSLQPPRSSLKGQSPRQQNTIIHAHSAIMRQYPTFNSLIHHFPRPNDSPKIHKLIDIDLQAMRLLINFLYLDQIEGPGYMGIVDWRPIFQLAHRFKVPRLVELSLSALCKDMKVETVLPTLFGWAYQHPDYEDRLLELLMLHLHDVFWPTLKESLEPYRGHQEFERVCGKLAAMEATNKHRRQGCCVMPE